MGWNLSQGLSISRERHLDREPPALKNISLGGQRFVEFYQPLQTNLSLYFRPAIGLSYTLQNSFGQDNGSLISQTRQHTLSLGADLSAGLAWRFAAKWALYGGFAFVDPIRMSGGLFTSENYRISIAEYRGWTFDYQLSPVLTSGRIGLGFRYFYERR